MYKSNFYFYEPQSSLLYEASRISCIAPLGNKVSPAMKCPVSLQDNYACSISNVGATLHLLKRRLLEI